ncbi:hypothetical protein [Kitasatospora sp. NPDC002965]|uniref:hypothetical protein n=1 Tax=Kitasatospora sp. NPDC002965 TaxID=3154775 RepID=UPI0033A554B5
MSEAGGGRTRGTEVLPLWVRGPEHAGGELREAVPAGAAGPVAGTAPAGPAGEAGYFTKRTSG